LAYSLSYKRSVTKDLKRIDKKQVRRILESLEKKLQHDPLSAGKALGGEFDGLGRIRLGDYRAIYSVSGNEVIILRIAHRKESYRK
jgi:mRNA interferase RelE/StbE